MTKLQARANRPVDELRSAGHFGFAQARLTRVAVPTWLVATASLLLSALREIFDESAYSRFLARHKISSGPSAYAAFLREQEGARARRPKCC